MCDGDINNKSQLIVLGCVRVVLRCVVGLVQSITYPSLIENLHVRSFSVVFGVRHLRVNTVGVVGT